MVPSSKKSGVTWMGPRPGQGPSLSLAIFGKHPGWDDHIDDLGLDTPRLVDVKRTLYLDALSGSIDSGAWEKLDSGQLLPAFGHEVVWFSPAGLVVGRLWASRDGKGRTKYPMFVMAHCDGISAAGIDELVMPRLAEIERLCSATTSASDVCRILDDARNALREAIKGAPGEVGAADVRSLGAIADSPAMGPDRVGLHRILYEVQRELGKPVSKSERKSMTRMGDGPAQHLRVPACAERTFDSARLWAGLLGVRSDRAGQVLAVRAIGAEYSDLIVGGVTASTLFCLRASLKGLPMASDVPYNLDAAFRTQCEAMVAAWRVGQTEPEEPRDAASARGDESFGAESSPSERSEPSDRPPKRWFQGWMGLATLTAGAAALVGAGYAITRDTKPTITPSDVASSRIPGAAPGNRPPGKTEPSPRPEVGGVRTGELGSEATDTAKANAIAQAKERNDAEDRAQASARVEAARLKKTEAEAIASRESAARDLAARTEAAREVLAEKERKVQLAAEDGASASRKSTLESLEAETVSITQLLDQGYGPSDTVAGKSVRERLEQLAARPLFPEVRGSEPVASLYKRCAALDTISTNRDVRSLVRQSIAATPLAESLASWERLAAEGTLGWPATDEDLGEAAQALVALKAASNRVKDGARAASLTTKVENRARSMWSRAMGSAARSGRADAVEAVVARMPALGVGLEPEGAMSVHDRYNVLVSDLKRDLAKLGEVRAADAGKVAALTARIERFTAEARASAGAVLATPEVSGAVGMLAASAASLASSEPEPVAAPAPMGPARRGWAASAQTVDSIPRVTFSPPGGGAPMDFAQIEGPGGPFFLATTEVSVGDLIAAIDAVGKWAEFAKLMSHTPGKGDPRSGSRTWTWTAGSPAKVQLSVAGPGDTSAGWLPPLATMQGQAYYPGRSPEPPSLGSPMVHVTVPAAAYVAALLGCRLPTREEWLAAASDSRLVNANPNYRDSSWKAQVDHVRAIPASRRADFPDGGVFWPPSVKKTEMGSAQAVSSAEDGQVWPAPVASGDGVLKNLLGNVAEMCVDDSRVFAGEPSPEGILGALGRGESVRILGASALSPREVDPKTPYTLTAGVFGRLMFSDVGFRLAFSAIPGTNPAPAGKAVKGSELAAALKFVAPPPE